MLRPLAFGLVLSALASTASASDAREVRNFAADFLDAYRETQTELQDWWGILPYITQSLDEAFKTAVVAEMDSAEKTPAGDKPCLWEGAAYFSNYEGVTEYRLSQVYREGAQWHVPVAFTYHEASGPDYNWTDVLVIEDHPEGLLVDDVIHPGGKRLKQVLLSHCKE